MSTAGSQAASVTILPQEAPHAFAQAVVDVHGLRSGSPAWAPDDDLRPREYLARDVWVRRGTSAALGVVGLIIGLGWGRIAFSRTPIANAADIDGSMNRGSQPMRHPVLMTNASELQHARASDGPLPALDRAVAWLNSVAVE